METPPQPERYSDEDWLELKDVAEQDDVIPESEYADHLKPILLNIAAYAEARNVEPPFIVVHMLGLPTEEYYTLQWWIGRSKLDVQLWAGDQKFGIFKQIPKSDLK